MPVYFERREERLTEVKNESLRKSNEYQAALEKVRGQGDEAFMTSRDGVKILNASEVHELSIASTKSLNAWKRFHSVYHVTPLSCTCPMFVKFHCCKHHFALKNFVLHNVPVLINSPPSPAHSLHRAPFGNLTNTPQGSKVPSNWTSPNTAFYHPKPREPNALQRLRQ